MRQLFVLTSALFIFGQQSIFSQTLTDPNLVVENVITAGGTANQPTAIAFLGSNDILVTEKATGRVRRIYNGTLSTTNALDLNVANNSERGLLGMALDPLFPTNPHVYLYYSRAASDGGTMLSNRISRFTWDGSTLSSELTLLDMPFVSGDGPNHDGGIILFGPPTASPANQKLYAIVGDLNRNNQTENYSGGAAPDDTACVLRINPNGTTPSGAEKGPFFDVAGANASLQRMYAYGIRNSFGMDFDPVSGALWDTENGPGNPNTYDEVNRVDAAFNSGWENQMGPTGFPGVTQSGGAAGKITFGAIGTYSEPEFSWREAVAPTGIHFLRSTNLGVAYQHDCFVCSNNSPSKIYRFDVNGARTGFVLAGTLADTVFDSGSDSDTAVVFGSGFSVPTDIETGPDGNLYVCSLGSGRVLRIRSIVAAVDDWQLFD